MSQSSAGTGLVSSGSSVTNSLAQSPTEAGEFPVKTYYVDSVAGDDENPGTKERPWKTLDKVNNTAFNPGDRVLLRRNRVWRGTLVVSSSGTAESPILFGAYGAGRAPLIMRTEKFSNWKKYRSFVTDRGVSVIWTGRLPGVRNSFGAVKGDKRVYKHNQWEKIQLGDMQEGAFYFPLNSGYFYYRSDDGDPGALEIGVRPQAILIDGKSNIIVDAIDVWGPGGIEGRQRTTGHAIIQIQGNSSNVVIRNLEISHGNSFGIRSTSRTRNVKYLNLAVHDNASTGIYMNSLGGEIGYCRSYSNGLIESDRGDRGGIGILRGGNIRIHHNEVFGNGRSNDSADFEIGIVQARKPVFVDRNYIHDCIQGCVQIAEGGDNSTIAYNIISGFGSSSGKPSSPGVWSGIRIGGGASGAKNIKVYNNIIHGGESLPTDTHAGLYFAWFDESGAKVANNIFFNNRGKDISVRKKAIMERVKIMNNLFYKANAEPLWNWRGVDIRSLADWKRRSGMGQNSIVADPLFKNSSGQFVQAEDYILATGSPAIDRGVDVGMLEDYLGRPVPKGATPDIGAFEVIR